MEKQEELKSVMYHLAEAIRISTNLLSPVLVDASSSVLKALGGLELENLEQLKYGFEYINKVESNFAPLFKRLDMEKELAELIVEEPKIEYKPEINFDDFTKLELRVGEIIASEKVKNSDKLLVSQVKIGSDVRQIVSGIANFYEPSQIIGKKVMVVVNLAPAKIRGNMSYGMLLCAEEEGKLTLIEVPNSASGAKIS